MPTAKFSISFLEYMTNTNSVYYHVNFYYYHSYRAQFLYSKKLCNAAKCTFSINTLKVIFSYIYHRLVSHGQHAEYMQTSIVS